MIRDERITNNFPGGLFTCVREISLFDEHYFQQEFFRRIAQSFPLMKNLKIVNEKPSNEKRFLKSNGNNKNVSIIKYPHLLRDMRRLLLEMPRHLQISGYVTLLGLLFE